MRLTTATNIVVEAPALSNTGSVTVPNTRMYEDGNIAMRSSNIILYAGFSTSRQIPTKINGTIVHTISCVT
jgi:hypothetical protein